MYLLRYGELTGNPEKKRLLERPKHRWMAIFEWIFKNMCVNGAGLISLRFAIIGEPI